MIFRPQNKKLIILVLILIIAGILFLLFRGKEDTWVKDQNGNWIMHGNPEIKDFDTCAKKYPVMASYPERCAVPNGPSFTKKYR